MSNQTPFNPVLFLYLNPEFSVLSNISTIEDARDYYNVNSNAVLATSNVWWSIDPIPKLFDDAVYISDHKNEFDVSGINAMIKGAMINDGETVDVIERDGRYLSTIYRSIYNRGTNLFKFNLPGDLGPYYATGCNMNVGDWVKVIKNNSEFHYAYISSITDNETFTLCNNLYSFTDCNSDYVLYGVKLYDPLRLARIAYLRDYTACNFSPTNGFTAIDEDFNYDLYQILYPDAQLLSREAAFIDYTNRLDNEDKRIGRTRDIVTDSNLQYPLSYDLLTVHQHLNLDFSQPTGRITWDGTDLFYLTKDSYRKATDIPLYFDGLITERAIKAYVDRNFLVLSTFSNIEVSGTATFSNNVYMDGCNTQVTNLNVLSNMRVYGTSIFDGPLQLNCNVDFLQPVNFLSEVLFENPGVTMNSPLVTNCNMTANGKVAFSNYTTFAADAKFSNNVYMDGSNTQVTNLNVLSNMYVHGPSRFDGPLQLNCNADFLQPVNFFGEVVFENPSVTMSSPLVTNCNMTANGEVAFSNYTTFAADATFIGSLITNSNLEANGSITFNGDTIANGIVTFSNRVEFFSDTVLNGITTLSNQTHVFAPIDTYDQFMSHGTAVFKSNVVLRDNLESYGETYIVSSHASNAFIDRGFASNLEIASAYIANAMTSNAYIENMFGNTITVCNLYAQFIANDSYTSISNMTQYLSSSNSYTIDSVIDGSLHALNARVEYLSACNAYIDVFTVGETIFDREATFNTNVEIVQDLLVGGTCYGGRIAISDYLSVAPQSLESYSNMVLDNAHINETLSVNGFMEVGNVFTISNTMLKVNGIMEAINYDVTSDINLKKNVRQLETVVDVDVVMDAITPVVFQYKHKYKGLERCGFIAQDIDRALPLAVGESVNYKVTINKHASVDKDILTLENHEFTVGDKLSIIVNASMDDVRVVMCTVTSVQSEAKFTISESFGEELKKCTVYEILYDTVKIIDYNQITAVLFSVVKELRERVRDLETNGNHQLSLD